MLLMYICDSLLWCDTQCLGSEHDRRAMCIIGTDIDALMATHLLKANPDISLNIFNHMPKVDRAIGIG